MRSEPPPRRTGGGRLPDGPDLPDGHNLPDGRNLPDGPGQPDRRAVSADPPPLHRQPRLLLAVALGGAVGAPLRYGMGLAVAPSGSGFPVGTLLVNLVGCLLLGALVEALALRGRPGTTLALYARPFAGSGLLGAFTTYSTFAVETDRLLLDGRAGTALAYVLSSLLGGLLAAAAGIAAVRRTAP